MSGLLEGQARLGPLPAIDADELLQQLAHRNLLGRGGAGFPMARKWRAVRDGAHGKAAVLANGAEGEPLSRKDRTLMAQRPHLVIDGALLAARSVGADDIIFYVGAEHGAARTAMRRALSERSERAARQARVLDAPAGYVSGEESAAVHYVNAGDARPTSTPPRPFERGVGGRPTLVQNVESLAAAALLARGLDSGTALVTTSGAVRLGGVQEISIDATAGQVAAQAGGLMKNVQAVLLGGYFGSWAPVDDVWNLPIEPNSLRARGLTFGCGVLSFLPEDACGVNTSAKILRYLASQSARQCGPCVFGLGAIAAAAGRLADRTAQPEDLQRLARWSGQLTGRGACKHPDGAAGLLRSALEVFADDFLAHQHRRCVVRPAATRLAAQVPVGAVA
jgi:NADH:ubiquinone oxidoreductase subunit F (NADH-binding)